MKVIHLLSGLLVLSTLTTLPSCQKELQSPSPAVDSTVFWQSLKIQLQHELNSDVFRSIDWSKASRTAIDSQGVAGWLVQLPLPAQQELSIRSSSVHFNKVTILLRTNLQAKLQQTRLVYFTNDYSNVKVEDKTGQLLFSSKIVDGYVEAWHTDSSVLQRSMPAPDWVTLPEVIVTGSYPPSGSNFSFHTWISFPYFSDNLDGPLNDWNYSESSYLVGGGGGGGGSSSGYYNPSPWDNNNASQAAGENTGGGGTIVPIEVSFGDMDEDEAIDLAEYLKCFESIPDQNARCVMTLYTDIPINGNPNEFFDWGNGSPGHAFIGLSKSNGGQTAQQFFGFYPQSGFKSVFTGDPVRSKVVDNSSHEYNGSIQLKLTPAQLRDVINRSLELAQKKYDIDDYNCTDFALDIFNWPQLFRDHLVVPLFKVPGSSQDPRPNSRTPHGIYIKLNELKNNNDPLAGQIQIPVNTSAATGSGPC